MRHRIEFLFLFFLFLLTYLLTTSQQEQCHISVNRTIRYIDVEPIIDIDDIEAPLVCSGRMTFSRDEVMRMESRMREEDNVTSIASAVSRRLKLIRSAETGSGQSRNGNIREAMQMVKKLPARIVIMTAGSIYRTKHFLVSPMFFFRSLSQ